jgi:CubicO group peptidase (beta-lactamase class C family)
MGEMPYWPTAEQWKRRAPAAAGLSPERLAEAIAFHETHETKWRRDFLTDGGRYIGVADEPEAPDEVLGPVRPRRGPNGLVLRGGYIVAEWGDTLRADMTFSVAKSYLAVLAGLALERGLIGALDDPVRETVHDGGFDGPQNRPVTWRQLLQQTSEWTGTLWGKPDSIDHHRDVRASELGAADKGRRRTLARPGAYWEYNDVRVNRLSLSLLRVFREPLADVLRTAVMEPIGASHGWEWVPYRNSWTDVAGVRLPSVPGGSHWGGGLWMSTRDHARFGLLVARDGVWEGRALLPPGWVAEMRRPCAVNPDYGLLWWLNTGRRQFPAAPASAFAARGAGSNVIFVDPEDDLVAVVRWIEKPAVADFIARVLASIER